MKVKRPVSEKDEDDSLNLAYISTEERFFLYLISGFITIGDIDQSLNLCEQYFNCSIAANIICEEE